MDEYIVVPTTAEITIAVDDKALLIKQCWGAISADKNDAVVKVPRILLTVFLDTIFSQLGSYELNSIRNECEAWLDMAREKAAKASAVVKE